MPVLVVLVMLVGMGMCYRFVRVFVAACSSSRHRGFVRMIMVPVAVSMLVGMRLLFVRMLMRMIAHNWLPVRLRPSVHFYN